MSVNRNVTTHNFKIAQIQSKFLPMKVNLNGSSWGVMIAEEQYSNALPILKELGILFIRLS